MNLTDTHTHLYLEQFDGDRDEMIMRAIKAGVNRMLLPNIDKDSIEGMKQLCRQYPAVCYPMMGLHPTSVKDDYKDQLNIVEKEIEASQYIAIGEIGIDLYWDKSHFSEQQYAFRFQIELAKKHQLPIVIHSRNSFEEIFEIMDESYEDGLRGVFHCFTGTTAQAEKIIQDYGFMLGIGGVVTFKNSHLSETIKGIELKHLLLETDAPFLSPVPFRGKRNESSYITYVAAKIAETKGISVEDLARLTSENAEQLFQLT